MSATFLRLTLCAVVMAGLAGCGGSSSSSSGGGGNNDGGGPTTVTYDFTSGVNPAVVATQIGTGTYTQAALSSGKLTLSIPSGETKFSVAYLCPPRTGQSPEPNYEYINQNSTLDGTLYTGTCYEPSTSQPQQGMYTAQVNAAAITGGAWVVIDGVGQQWSSSTISFAQSLSVGTQDVAVMVEDAQFNMLAIKILPKQTIPGALNGGNPIVFSVADKLTEQPITYSNIQAGFTRSTFADYVTAGGYRLFLGLHNTTGLYNATQYPAIPAASVQSGDYYEFTASAAGVVSPGVTESVGLVLDTTTGGGPETFNLPAPMSYSGPAPADLPSFDLSYQGFAGQQRVSEFANLYWNPNSNYVISLEASENFLAGSSTLTFPDLSAVPGFLTVPSGAVVSWSAGYGQLVSTSSAAPNLDLVSVGASGSFTAP